MSEALAVALPPARRAALTPLGEVELRRSAPPGAVFDLASGGGASPPTRTRS